MKRRLTKQEIEKEEIAKTKIAIWLFLWVVLCLLLY